MLVKVNHNGFCGGYKYTQGVAIELPEEVLKSLGKEAYEVVEKGSEQKQVEHSADKQIKTSSNK